MPRRLPLVIASLLVALTLLGGCAATTIISAALTVTTGKGLTEQALSVVTGMDCNVLGSMFAKHRAICVEPGSEATKNDFKGLFASDTTDRPVIAVPKARPRPDWPPESPGVAVAAGSRVYAMAPVAGPDDALNAELVRALPPIRPLAPGQAAPPPVLLSVDGQSVYAMAPIDGRARTKPAVAPRRRPKRVRPGAAPLRVSRGV